MSSINNSGSIPIGQTTRNNHFVAVVPFRIGPKSGEKEYLVVPYAEDQTWFRTREEPEDREQHLARVKSEIESGRISFLPKFIGGTCKDQPQEDKNQTGSAEFLEETNISIDPEDLWARTLNTYQEIISGRVIPGSNPEQRYPDHHKYFLLVDANELWPEWKKIYRREIKVEMPYIVPVGGRQRPPEILGIPDWIPQGVLRAQIHHSHSKALDAAIEFFETMR